MATTPDEPTALEEELEVIPDLSYAEHFPDVLRLTNGRGDVAFVGGVTPYPPDDQAAFLAASRHPWVLAYPLEVAGTDGTVLFSWTEPPQFAEPRDHQTNPRLEGVMETRIETQELPDGKSMEIEVREGEVEGQPVPLAITYGGEPLQSPHEMVKNPSGAGALEGEDFGAVPDEEGDVDPLAGVNFASSAAHDAAATAGLSASDFEGVEPSGASGGYTVADVEELTA